VAGQTADSKQRTATAEPKRWLGIKLRVYYLLRSVPVCCSLHTVPLQNPLIIGK
jgi:hypothetical protein